MQGHLKWFALALVSLAVSCGSNDSTSVGNDSGGSGAGHADASGVALGGCNFPNCLASLAASCQPSGTCTEQFDNSTLATSSCFANGVKQILTIDPITGDSILTYKNGSVLCYTVEIPAVALGTPTETLAFKNSTGQVVATGTSNIAGTTQTITCAGGSTVTLNPACNTAGSDFTGYWSCSQGTCAP